MGQLKNHPPCLQFAAAFSGSDALLAEVWQQLEGAWGPIADLSPAFDFVESEYYHATMGMGLKKQFALFDRRYDPARLAQDKIFCNTLERTWMDGQVSPSANPTVPERPVNIDPGYMSMTKLVLASTKNREHRIYLRDGIYAEVTLAFRDQAWQVMPWTYADYQRQDIRRFLSQARGRFADSVTQDLRAERERRQLNGESS